MFQEKQLIVATANQGKVKEVRRFFEPYGYRVRSLADLPVEGRPEWEETEDTFEGNALIKANALSAWLGLPVLADDSGLCVDLLQGAPGVKSARFAGDNATDEENNQKLLDEMKRYAGHDLEERTARFVCALAWVDVNNNIRYTVRGECAGMIRTEKSGSGGFGYDPLFFLPQFDCTMAELTTDQKNQMSHRGQALQKLISIIESV